MLRLARRLPGFRYCLLLRLCSYTHRVPRLKLTVHWPLRLLYRRYTYLYGISIPYSTRIGGGLYLGHFGGIVVNAASVIGRNCNISHGVTLGQANRGGNAGVPVLGDRVYIGPGAKLVGGVEISSGVAIGANCVVTKDAPTNAVVVGSQVWRFR